MHRNATQTASDMPPPGLFDHRVAVFARPDDPADLRDLLQESLGLNRIDAGIAMHQVPGLLPQEFTREQAEQIAAAIGKLGLKAAAFATSDIPDFDHAELLHHVRCTEIGLEIAGRDGEFGRRIAWDDLRLVSIGRVPLEETRFYGTNTILRASPVLQDPYAATGHLEGLECWLVATGPLQVWRFDSEHMNYESVDAELTASGTANFELLASEIVRHARSAHLTPAARTYLNHGPVIEYDFVSSDELRRYTLIQDLLAQAVDASHEKPSNRG